MVTTQGETKMIILLDVDGVICNFIDGIIKLHNWPINHDDVSCWDYHKTFNVSDRDMWKPTEDGKWWTTLDEYEWAQELVSKLRSYDEVIFCTSPNLDSSCPSQKVKWLRDKGFMPHYKNEYQIGKRKELNAKSGAILIDDSDKNVERYRGHGGIAILFPQPWNKNKNYTVDRVNYTLQCLRDYYLKV